MKKLLFIVSICLVIFLLLKTSQAQPSQLLQLGHKEYGGHANRIAAKTGTNYDTVFVTTNITVRLFQVDHSNPGSPTELNTLNFNVENLNPVITVPNRSLVLTGSGDEIKIRDYVSQTDYGVPAGITSSWGISDIVCNNSGTTAFAVAHGGILNIIDLTNPASSSVISQLSFSNYKINAVTFSGSGGQDTLFIAGTGYKGLRMYNVTNPATPTLIATSLSGDSVLNDTKTFEDVAVIKDSIYVADMDSGFRSFSRSNINVPGNLTQIENVQTHYVTGADSILAISSNDGLRTRNIRMLTMSTNVNPGSWSPRQIVSTGNLLYIAFAGRGFQIYDISNPLLPSQVGAGTSTGDNVYDITADDRNYAYIANGIFGVHIMNLTTHSEVGSPLYYQNGCGYNKVFDYENTLVMSWGNGFDIVDITNPASPQLRGSYSTGINGINAGDLIKMTGIADTLFFVIGDNNGIKIFNIQNPLNITKIGTTINLPGGCRDIQFVKSQGNSSIFIFASPNAYGNGNLGIWKFLGATPPVFQDSTAGLVLNQQWWHDIFDTDGIFAYIINGSNNDSIRALNVSNPANIIDMGNIYGESYDTPTCVSLSGNSLHLGFNNRRGVRIIDVTNPTTPVLKDTFFNILDWPQKLKINGLNLLIAANGDGYYHLSDPYGFARVRLPRVTGMPKDSVWIPVKLLDNLSGLGIYSFETFFTYDTTRVQFVSFTRGTGVPAGDTLASNIVYGSPMTKTDTLRIARADSQQNISFGTDSTLLKIRFRIQENAPIQPLIQSTPITLSHLLFNEGFPAAEFKPGRINIIPRFGDANNDGKVSAGDASYILQYVIGLMPQPSLIVADVSNNGQVRAYDAALILKRAVNPLFKYPVETNYNLKQASAPVNKDVRIVLTTEQLNSDSEKDIKMEANSVIYAIAVKNISEVWSAEMIIDLGDGQRFTGYKVSSVSEGMTVQHRQEGNLLYVSMAGGEPISKDGTLLQVICQITDAEKMKLIDIQQFILNETVIENFEGSLSGVPKIYALSQNYPNPFNPVTEIRYQIPNPGKISLIIYNILGQQVKSLINTSQPAGYYTIRWNGRDDAGINVASGVYFYRIRAGNFVQTKKMMFIK